jgi:hypothetical protein
MVIYAAAGNKILSRTTLPPDVTRQSVVFVGEHRLDPWVFPANDWLISRADALHAARVTRSVKFAPMIVANVCDQLMEIAKIVDVRDEATPSDYVAPSTDVVS